MVWHARFQIFVERKFLRFFILGNGAVSSLTTKAKASVFSVNAQSGLYAAIQKRKRIFSLVFDTGKLLGSFTIIYYFSNKAGAIVQTGTIFEKRFTFHNGLRKFSHMHYLSPEDFTKYLKELCD